MDLVTTTKAMYRWLLEAQHWLAPSYGGNDDALCCSSTLLLARAANLPYVSVHCLRLETAVASKVASLALFI